MAENSAFFNPIIAARSLLLDDEIALSSATRCSSGSSKLNLYSEKLIGEGEGGKNEDEYFDPQPNI